MCPRLLLTVDDRVVKPGQTVHSRFPGGDAGIQVDEPAECLLDLTECMRDLDQAPHLNGAREETRRGYQEGEYHGDLVISDGEEVQVLLPPHDRPPVGKDLRETPTQPPHLILFAAVQRHALHVLAETHQVEAEVSFEALLVEVKTD